MKTTNNNLYENSYFILLFVIEIHKHLYDNTTNSLYENSFFILSFAYKSSCLSKHKYNVLYNDIELT